PEHGWDECLNFSRDLAAALARQHPSRYAVSIPKAGREKKILIDYLRNNRTNTSVAAFSTRARPTAPVSVPLTWNELPAIPSSDHFTVANLPERLRRRRAAPWQSYARCRQRLTAAMLEAVASLS